VPWRASPRVRARDYPSGRTPLVNFIAYMEPGGSSGGLWRAARHHMALTRRSVSSWLLRTG
jgi:hypothetical protein